MKHRGNPNKDAPSPFLASGKSVSWSNPTPTDGSLAVQQSLSEIFDEFTQVISGELKSMNLEEWPEGHPGFPKVD